MDRGDTGVKHFAFPGPGRDAVCSSAQIGFAGGSAADVGGVEVRKWRHGP